MADPRVITQTLTIGFNVDSGAESLIAEVDGRSAGFNSGRTSFRPGDDVYLLLYKSDNITIDSVIASKGTITRQAGDSPQTISVEETLIFPNEREASVSKPVKSSYQVTWLGNNAGNLTLDSDELTFRLSSEPLKPYAAVAKVSYSTEADVYKLTNTLIANTSAYEIVVVFTGVAND
jgi:hypothetical protein